MSLPTDTQRYQASAELLARLEAVAEAHPEGVVVDLGVLRAVGWSMTSDDRRLFYLDEARVIRDAFADAIEEATGGST